MKKPSYFNSEGYPSPTEYYAELHIMQEERAKRKALAKFRPLVYICSPFAGEVKKNIRKARLYSRLAVKRGYLPITPHLLFPQFLNDRDEFERKLGMKMGLVLMLKCREVWVFGQPSAGMNTEIKRALIKGMPVRYFNEKGLEVNHG